MKNKAELDNDFITIWSHYILSQSKSAAFYEVAKLAELGQLDAQQKWFLISGNLQCDAVNRQVKEYKTDDYMQCLVLANKYYNAEKDVLKMLIKDMKSQDTKAGYQSYRFDITQLNYYRYLSQAISLCDEKIKSGNGTLFDQEMYLEMMLQNPLHTDEDLKNYRKVRSALACEYCKDKSDPKIAFALSMNYRNFGRKKINTYKSNLILQRLSQRKLSKTYENHRGPSVRVNEDKNITVFIKKID